MQYVKDLYSVLLTANSKVIPSLIFFYHMWFLPFLCVCISHHVCTVLPLFIKHLLRSLLYNRHTVEWRSHEDTFPSFKETIHSLVEETGEWTYVSGNHSFSEEYRRTPPHTSCMLPEEMSAGMLIGGFVLCNIILTMSEFYDLLNNLCFKSSYPFKIQIYLRANSAVRWLSSGNWSFPYSTESFVIAEIAFHLW